MKVNKARLIFAVVFLAVISSVGVSQCNRFAKQLSARKFEKGYSGCLKIGSYVKECLVDMNGLWVRYAIGGRRCNHVYRLAGGSLIAEDEIPCKTADSQRLILNQEDAARKSAKRLIDLSNRLAKTGGRLIFALAPCKQDCEKSYIPWQTGANEKADCFMTELAREGVRTIDFRSEMSQTAEMVSANFYPTDHHWNGDASFRAFQRLAREIGHVACTAEECELIDSLVSQEGLWRREEWPGVLLGSAGRRCGPYFGGVDPVVYFVPQFATEIAFTVPKRKDGKPGPSRSGDFLRSVMDLGKLDISSGLMSSDGYCVHIGGNYPLGLSVNRQAPIRKRILMVVDSFARPVQAYFSTLFSEVDAIDLRYYQDGSLMRYIKQRNPDIVLYLYNVKMLNDKVLVVGVMDEKYSIRYHRHRDATDDEQQVVEYSCGKTKCLAWAESELGWKRGKMKIVGWDVSPAAKTVIYKNGQRVSDLAAPDATVDLYAVWQ